MQSAGERSAALRRLGAIGIVSIQNPKNMDIPWERSALARFMPAMSLADPAMDDSRGLSIAVAVNPARADKVLAGSGHTFREILDAADAGKPLPHFAIPARLKATVAVERADVESQNVAAVLPGSDPALKGEYVAFTAHLDHLGIGKPIGGDAIYNGAMDNASGVASLLDVAAILKELGREAPPFGPVRRGHGRGEGPARLEVLRQRADGRPEGDRRRHQYRHVPPALPAQVADGLRPRGVRPGRRRRRRGEVVGRSPRSPTRSRSGTSSSGATSTASSAEASPRWR